MDTGAIEVTEGVFVRLVIMDSTTTCSKCKEPFETQIRRMKPGASLITEFRNQPQCPKCRGGKA